MSGSTACRCKPRSVEVLAYKVHHSAFNGYRATPTPYSSVMCTVCGACWRTKAAYVDKAPLAQHRSA